MLCAEPGKCCRVDLLWVGLIGVASVIAKEANVITSPMRLFGFMSGLPAKYRLAVGGTRVDIG